MVLENKLNIPVTFYLGKNPDEDLIFGIKAKYYISTGGGYGKLIKNLVRNNGGKVLDIYNPKSSFNHFYCFGILLVLLVITLFSG